MRDKKTPKKQQKSEMENKKRYNNTYSLESYRQKKSSEANLDPNPYTNPYAKPSYSRNPYQRSNYNPYATHKPYHTSYTNPYARPSSFEQETNSNKEEGSQQIQIKHKLSKKQIEKLKRKKRRIYKIRIFSAFIFIVLLIFGIIKGIDILSKPTVSYQTVKRGMIDNSVELTGLIVRDEKVIKSKQSGNLYYLTNEGQKVQKNGQVCYVGDAIMTESIENEIESIDTSIYSMQQQRASLSTYQPEVNLLNLTIQTQMKNFYANYKEMTATTPIYLLRKELEHVIQTRTTIYASDTTERLEDLQEERSKLIGQIDEAKDVMSTDEAGIVSYYIDGLEETIHQGTLQEFSFEFFQNTIKNVQKMKPIIQANKDEPAYKLITSQTWYLITYVSEEEAAFYEEGKNYEIYFKEGSVEKLPFMIHQKIQEGDKVKLILASDEQMIHFLPYRKINFTMGKNKAEGLKIPLTAIVEKNVLEIPSEYIVNKDHSDGVIVQLQEGEMFIPVSIEFKENDKTYVTQQVEAAGGVSLGQTIKHPETGSAYALNQVTSVQGVYVVNSRYTEFKRIDMLLTNNEYGILDENKSALKAYDQMISNPKNINENELLKYMNVQNE